MSRSKAKAKELPERAVSQAEAGFRAAAEILAARAGRDPEMPNVDLQDAGLVTLDLVKRLGAAEYAPRLGNLERIGEAAPGLLTRASTLAWASIHARRKFVLQTETQSGAKVPPALDESSRVLRDRMLRPVTYHFEDHPELGPVVSFLRSGVGYLDRGNDLEELAEIYREHRDVIAHDPKHYRATDEADARQAAQSLYRALGITRDDDDRDWAALQGELWPALKDAYADLRRVGLFLSRDESLFPGLIAAVRARRAAPAKVGDPQPDDPGKNPVPAPT
ncbi:MAG: hypothetical protein U0325_13405 [Polyangiales bacterium]